MVQRIYQNYNNEYKVKVYAFLHCIWCDTNALTSPTIFTIAQSPTTVAPTIPSATAAPGMVTIVSYISINSFVLEISNDK